MRAFILLVCLILAACGGGGETQAPVAVAQPATDLVQRVAINEDFRPGNPDGEYLVNVTFATAKQEFNVEYCDTPIHLGDVVRLEPYGVGTTLIYVNDVLVGNIIDWEATEKDIMQRG